MFTFILGTVAIALIAGGTIIYKTTDKNARTFILAVEFFQSVGGRVTSNDIQRFKNKEEFQIFVKTEEKNAEKSTYDPSNLHGLRYIYIAEAPEELLREMKKNCTSHADIEKYVNKPPKELNIITINIKRKEF